ncbi:hypothetical protein C1645_769657 [Glomus cerebriforme]|uniref:Transmembrane protein n=1 Tax=Glomus cerebriforme TaxID=658196 RepID=A0A397SWJ6_9GLOM|nr:hypothetical protein C1645_769657 [Glomus cerebriforme]
MVCRRIIISIYQNMQLKYYFEILCIMVMYIKQKYLLRVGSTNRFICVYKINIIVIFSYIYFLRLIFFSLSFEINFLVYEYRLLDYITQLINRTY